jgi:minimal CRISPR polymerase domain
MTKYCADKPNIRFVAIDGDKIGQKLEQLVAEEMESELLAFAACVESQLKSLRLEVEHRGGRILLCSGDSILAHVDCVSLNAICAAVPMIGPITFSVGIGARMSEAMYALKAAKALGRARIVNWDELVADRSQKEPCVSAQTS